MPLNSELTGVEWILSDERFQRDARIARICLALSKPVFWSAQLLTPKLLHASTFYEQARIGKGGEEFTFRKLRTLYPETTIKPSKEITSNETNAYGRFLRATGIDELPQLTHIEEGTMAFFGSRPVIPQEINDIRAHVPAPLFERWYDGIYCALPQGIISSFGIAHRVLTRSAMSSPLSPLEWAHLRVQLDIQDVTNASRSYELGLIQTIAQHVPRPSSRHF